MIDLSKLTTKELRQLEQKIQEEKETRNELEGWKITFTVRYNPFKNEQLTKERNGDDELGDFMINDVADLFIQNYDISVSDCDIVEATPEELNW